MRFILFAVGLSAVMRTMTDPGDVPKKKYKFMRSSRKSFSKMTGIHNFFGSKKARSSAPMARTKARPTPSPTPLPPKPWTQGDIEEPALKVQRSIEQAVRALGHYESDFGYAPEVVPPLQLTDDARKLLAGAFDEDRTGALLAIKLINTIFLLRMQLDVERRALDAAAAAMYASLPERDELYAQLAGDEGDPRPPAQEPSIVDYAKNERNLVSVMSETAEDLAVLRAQKARDMADKNPLRRLIPKFGGPTIAEVDGIVGPWIPAATSIAEYTREVAQAVTSARDAAMSKSTVHDRKPSRLLVKTANFQYGNGMFFIDSKSSKARGKPRVVAAELDIAAGELEDLVEEPRRELTTTAAIFRNADTVLRQALKTCAESKWYRAAEGCNEAPVEILEMAPAPDPVAMYAANAPEDERERIEVLLAMELKVLEDLEVLDPKKFPGKL